MLKQFKFECPHCIEGFASMYSDEFCSELPCECCGESVNIAAMIEDIADTMEWIEEDGF